MSLTAMTIDWGSAPAWVAAAGGLVTLGLSVRVAWVQVSDRRREHDDRRQEQARLVTAWIPDAVHPRLAVRVIVKNSSDQAVYNLRICLEVGVRGRYVEHRNGLGPHEVWDANVRLAGYPRGELEAPTLAFTDASGLEWLRCGTGELRHPTDEDREHHLSQGPGAFESIEHRDRTVDRNHALLAEQPETDSQ